MNPPLGRGNYDGGTMATLLDIAEVSELISVPGKGGTKQMVEVFGVSSEGIAYLFKKFPEIRQLITGKAVERETLAELAPGAIAAIIAATTGMPGNKKAELIASRLPLETQLDILDATVRLTMPGGLGPFVEKLTSMVGMLGLADESHQGEKGAIPTTAPDTKLPSPSSS